MKRFALVPALAFTAAFQFPLRAQEQQALGESVYQSTCATCHEGNVAARIPTRSSLSEMTARGILSALEEGKMRVHGEALTAQQRRVVAEFLAGESLGEDVVSRAVLCAVPESEMRSPPVHWSGWGGNLRGTGFQPAERAGVSPDDVPQLELLWAYGFPNANEMRSKPAVLGDRLIIGSQSGDVVALGIRNGCEHWRFSADATIRSGVIIGDGANGQPVAFFADMQTNVYAVNALSGELIWKTRAGHHERAMNTGTLAYHDGRLYVPISSLEVVFASNPSYPCCTSSGALAALDAETGEELWYHRVIQEEATQVGEREDGAPLFAPSGAPVWSSPTIDVSRGVVYVGTGENYTRPASSTSDAVLAIDLETGELVWKFQALAEDAYNLGCPPRQTPGNCPDPMGPDLDFGMAPMIATLPGGGEILIAGQKSGIVWGLDPEDGRVIWNTRVGKGTALGGIHWGMAVDSRYAYAANADNELAVLVDVNPEREFTPGMYALDLATGKVAWSVPAPDCGERNRCVPANSAQPTVIPGVVFAGALDGHLRAYSTDDGSILWDFDTVRDFDTVNGIPGRGGSLDIAGPVIAHGIVFVNSGYGQFNQIPGNVLLAFGVRR